MRILSKYISGGAVRHRTQFPKYVPEEEAAFERADQQHQLMMEPIRQRENLERFVEAVQRIPEQNHRRRQNIEILNEYYNYIENMIDNIPMDMYFEAGLNPNIFRNQLQLLGEHIENYENGNRIPINIWDALKELRESIERFLAERENVAEQENVNVLPTN